MSTNPPNNEQIQQAIEDVKTQTALNKGGIPLEISLPTGQVYKGETPQELLDNLAKAQTEASRTISDYKAKMAELENTVSALKQQIPPPKSNDPEKDELTKEYFAKWSQDPTEANKIALAQILGVSPDKVGPMLRTAVESQMVNTAADEFLTRCPEFPQTPQNAQLMKEALAARYGTTMDAATADNLELVYNDLVRNGRIVPNPLPASRTVNANNPLPNLRGNSAPPNPVTDILSQAYTMPLDQLKQVMENLQAKVGR